MKGAHLHWISYVNEERLNPEEEKLNRALIAGLILEVILDVHGLSEDPSSRRLQIKNHLQKLLVSHLAGLISLDSFRLLARKLDHWFDFYYPLLSPLRASPAPRTQNSAALLPFPARRLSPSCRVLREKLLEDCLEGIQEWLPRRRHRKLDRKRLGEFLRHTRGGWFRLKDFESYFNLDRKTAWEYVHKLWQAQLLTRNQGRSAAVRYCLHPRFSRVMAEDLRQAVTALLPDLSWNLISEVGDWLIVTGGESFWEEEWQNGLPEALRREVITRLTDTRILETVGQSGRNRLLRLSRRWLRSSGQPN